MSNDNDLKREFNSAFDESKRDGQEPLEEVGPGECGPEPEQCEVKPGELDGQPGACQIEHDEELLDAFPVESTPLMMDETDGMPREVDSDPNDALAHPFTIDTVNCIEDTRQYVQVFDDEPGSEDYKNEFRRFGINCWSKSNVDGTKKERLVFQSNEVFVRSGHSVVSIGIDEYLLVRPIRPRCKHYKRQVFAHDGIAAGDYGHFLVFRNCTIRKSVGGAFMSLMNEACYACDYRDPPDEASVKKYLDEPDQKKLDERPDLVLVPLFGLDGDEVKKENSK